MSFYSTSYKIKFEPKSMINVAKEYHEQVCTTGEECIVFETTEDKAYTRFKFSVYGGALLFIDRQGELESLLIPAIGGRININVPRLNENLSFQADLMIAKVHERFDKMSYHVLLPPQLGVKYVLGNHKIRPAFGAGISISPGTMPYLSLGLNYQVNKKQAVFFDAEWISARKLYDSEFNTKIFYFKLGYTF